MTKHIKDPAIALCWEWVRWSLSRKYYCHAPPKSILARLQPSKSGREPDAHNSALLQCFNSAVFALGDMPMHQAGFTVFMAHYMGDGEVIKRVVARLQISRSTYYKRLEQFTQAAYSMAHSLLRHHAPHVLLAPTAPDGQTSLAET